MRAVHILAPHEVAIVDAEGPIAGQDESLIAPSFVGLCGTDLEMLSGSMPYFAEGVAAYPLQPGHEVTGTIVESVDPLLPTGTPAVIDPVVGCGECEACAAGFQTRCTVRRELGLRLGMPGGACELIAVPRRNVYPIPAEVSVRDAVLVEPGVTALNAVNRIGDVSGRRALIVGAGTLGLIAAQLLLAGGADVDVLVVEAPRAELVQALGMRSITTLEGGRYHAVVEAAGTQEAVHTALESIAPGGQIALAGVQSAQVDGFDVNQVVLNDATVHGVLNGPGLYGVMLEALAAGTIDAGALIEAEFGLSDVEDAFALLRAPGRRAPKIVLRVQA